MGSFGLWNQNMKNVLALTVVFFSFLFNFDVLFLVLRQVSYIPGWSCTHYVAMDDFGFQILMIL